MKKEEPKYISLAEAAKLTSYSQDYISLLCRQGKMQAVKLGRNWVTTKEWVYSYIDNTAGKGESIVPVRIKEAAVKGEGEKKSGEKTKARALRPTKKPFYGQQVLEIAFFCFACILWTVNIHLFYEYFQQKNFSAAPAISASTTAKTAPDPESADVPEGGDAILNQAAPAAGLLRIENLPAFEPETDPAVIETKSAAIREIFGADLDVEVYEEFAVVNSKAAPEQKFLYILK